MFDRGRRVWPEHTRRSCKVGRRAQALATKVFPRFLKARLGRYEPPSMLLVSGALASAKRRAASKLALLRRRRRSKRNRSELTGGPGGLLVGACQA